MLQRVQRFLIRRIAPLAAAGLLLQATSCQATGAELFANLTAAVANNLINSFIFGVFNLTP